MASEVVDRVRVEAERYRHGEDRPLGAYAAIMAVNATVMAGILSWFRRTGRATPTLSVVDVVLTSLATHRVARLLTKDTVTSPIRAPFTRFEGPGGPSEVNERVRGRGWRHAIGELITCPFCAGEWVAVGFGAGWLFAPRGTRFVASMGSVLAVADGLQLAYAKLQDLATS